MTPYDRIAKIIRYMDEHQEEQPDLNALADLVGLSPFYFQRLFSEWAGVTPKDFLQCLTLSHARVLLKEGDSVLDAALDAGLSGPARLHDLCIKLEAATPGEIKAGGAGWTVSAGYTETPFGTALLAESPRGLCFLSFVEPSELTNSWMELKNRWSNAVIERDDKRAGELGALIFRYHVEGQPPCSHGTGQSPSLQPLKLYVKGTAFQVQVWQALLNIPPGKLASYGHLAAFIGKPAAVRALGTAVGCNPIAYLIPCHRVIRETGAIGGYHWGITRKKAILAWESGDRNAAE